MSAGLARNWWVVGLRGLAGVAFGLAVLMLPAPTLASLVLMFAAYLAADGLFAIMAGTRDARRGERWGMLVAQGAVNLAVAGGVLAWQAITIVPFFRLVSVWAVLSGALLLAAARRLSPPQGRWILVLAGTAAAGWGAAVAALAPAPDATLGSLGMWLFVYAAALGAMLLGLAGLLQRRHRDRLATSLGGV
jgi:uncharacterized membrane protein HdeD (DUF308 family)